MARKTGSFSLIALGAVAGLGGALAAASAVAARSFRARYEFEKRELERRGRAAPLPAASGPELPAPLLRYLEVSRAAGRPGLRLAWLRQRGVLRAAADKAWMPFQSEQVYAAEPPGFLWFAEAQAAPLLRMLARDKFVDGQGNMLLRLAGLVPIADARGPELDQGAALRFWGEVIAFPEMVRSPYLRWEAVHERQARLLVQQGALKLTALVDFNGQGFPCAVHAERYRDVNGMQVLTPWSGYLHRWRLIDGRMFPTSWEAVWHLPKGDLTAVLMQVLSVRTE